MSRARLAGLGAILILVVCPSPVDAHLVTTGLGPVYDGVGHLLLTPEDLLPALGLALFGGLRGAPHARAVLFLLPAAWLAGGGIGMLTGVGPRPSVAVVSFLALGLLVATDAPIPRGATAALAVAVGLLHGWSNGPVLAQSQLGLRGLGGIAATVFVVVALLSAGVVALRRPWTRIAVRVAGSWIAASGLLLLGWSLRGT
jgi:hydrogenase/urease accessory protein HupE